MSGAKSEQIHIRVTSSELAAIRRRAAETHLSVSNYLIKRALIDDGRPIIRTDIDTLQSLYRSLRGAANNLNQCTRVLNSRRHLKDLDISLFDAINSTSRATDAVAGFLEQARKNI